RRRSHHHDAPHEAVEKEKARRSAGLVNSRQIFDYCSDFFFAGAFFFGAASSFDFASLFGAAAFFAGAFFFGFASSADAVSSLAASVSALFFSFAFGSVVMMRSLSMSDVSWLRNIARRCDVVRPSFRFTIPCRIGAPLH